ncbi:MAG: hypothetical protein MUF54_08465 [Polyangiaceae bacterium]|nr:hypothetical protein [Polyangiaceae bacterium]
MVSPTQQTETIRRSKARRRAKSNSTGLMRRKTPAFPVHPEGYDVHAPDAKAPTDKTE